MHVERRVGVLLVADLEVNRPAYRRFGHVVDEVGDLQKPGRVILHHAIVADAIVLFIFIVRRESDDGDDLVGVRLTQELIRRPDVKRIGGVAIPVARSRR